MRQGIKNRTHATDTVFNPLHSESHNYGTSKLEQDFAHDFLDRYGVEYDYQFHAKEIGRYYDFFCKKTKTLLEIDGDWWHGNTDKYKKLNNMQKRSHAVDDIKNKWAKIHGLKLIRIWESDIRNNTPKVLQILREGKIID